MNIVKYILISLIIISISKCSLYAQVYQTSFINKKSKLPAKIIFINDYYEQHNRMFFLNRDYRMSYSQIVEYDFDENKVVNEIYSLEGNSSIIIEYDYDNNNIVWSTLRKEKNIIADIYMYSIHDNKLIAVKKDILCGKENKGFVPLSLSVDNGKVAWLEHSFRCVRGGVRQGHDSSEARRPDDPRAALRQVSCNRQDRPEPLAAGAAAARHLSPIPA